jgi:ACS family D-galactonate transporter-like MFS transporter
LTEATLLAEPELKNSRQRWWLALLLFSGMTICYAHRSALAVAAPSMIKDLGLSPLVTGVLLSGFFWSYALMQMPAGWVVDRFGVRRSYAIGFAFWSLASAAIGLARGLMGLLFFRVCLGLGQSIAFPASARAVANWFPDRERGTVTGSYLVGVRIGTALVGGIGSIMLARYGWKLFFVFTGILPMIWLLPWSMFLKKWEKGNGTSESVSSAAVPSPGFLESLGLLRQRSVLGIFLGFFAYDYAWFVYLNWLPGYLALERGFSTRELALYSSLPYVAMSVIVLVSGIFSDWLIRRGLRETVVRKTLIIVGLVIGLLIIPAGLVDDNIMAVRLLTISLCGLGICSPNTWTLTQAVCSKRVVGTVSGIQNFGGNIGGVIAPVITGYIAHTTHSFALALSLTGVVMLIGILAYAFLIMEPVQTELVAEGAR